MYEQDIKYIAEAYGQKLWEVRKIKVELVDMGLSELDEMTKPQLIKRKRRIECLLDKLDRLEPQLAELKVMYDDTMRRI